MKPVKIDDFHYLGSSFKRGDNQYSISSLIKASENLEVFNLPLQGIDIGVMPWNINNIKDFISHYKRVESADLNYSIILDDHGFICDGWHRVAKAILLGNSIIKAKRLPVMPDKI